MDYCFHQVAWPWAHLRRMNQRRTQSFMAITAAATNASSITTTTTTTTFRTDCKDFTSVALGRRITIAIATATAAVKSTTVSTAVGAIIATSSTAFTTTTTVINSCCFADMGFEGG